MEKCWNGMQSIAQQIKDPVTRLREAFTLALNQTISELIEKGYVESINRALMTIAMDEEIQNNCVNFPKTRKGLRAYIDEENVKRLLEYRNPNRRMLQNLEYTNGVLNDLEDSSMYKQVSVTSDIELFRTIGFYDIRPYSDWIFKVDQILGMKHPGRIPAGVVYNTLYFFTEPGDLVIDPMAGGGVVGDCCYEVKRKCKMYDIKPTREDINRHDLSKGLPKEAHNADLIFWDPPYYKRIPTKYGPHSISALERSDYLKFFEDFAQIAYESHAKKFALLISESTNSHTSTVHTDTANEEPIFLADYTKRFQKRRWRQINRISCNMIQQNISSTEIKEYREKKLIYGLARDLIIFQRD
jgi:hypothetical protein